MIMALIVLPASGAWAQRMTPESFALVNNSYDQQNPVLSPDGKTLYVTIANHPENIGGKRDPGDIWISVWTGTQWSAPVHGGTVLNDAAYNGVAGFSADGRQMVLLSHYNTTGDGPARTQGIAVSRYQGDGWTKPENLNIPYFQNKSALVSGYLSDDNNTLVFAAETYGTYGVEDIYISRRGADGRWSEPRNVGNTVNTQFQELCPSLSADGMTLYFSSNGRKGYGSFDVYQSTRLDDTFTHWSEPVNMGANVNTTGRELYYRRYERGGFMLYTSTLNSDGYGDVKYYRPDDALPVDTTNTSPAVVRLEEVTPVTKSEQGIGVHGRVLHARSGESVAARITFQEETADGITPASVTVQATVAQGYTTRVPSTKRYTVKIESPGFISAMEKLDVQTYAMRELEMNFNLKPIEVGTTVNLKSVLFEQSKTVLLPASYAELDVVVAFLRDNPNVRIELAGHTDNRGIPAQNIKLSQARVDRVKEYLVSKGIAQKRITGKGYGGTRPIASNDDEDTRQLNRRVEFTIKKL